MRARAWWPIAFVPLLALLSPAAPPATLAALRQSFLHPPDDARIMMRWWWFGPAVSKPELEAELRSMKAGGIGGVEVQPVYPLDLDDPAHGFRNLPYLSDDFLDALRFAASKARELGLRFDLTLGSGWPYGGPHIPIAQAASRLLVLRSAAPPALGPDESLVASFPALGLYFAAGHTRMMVKRAAAGAEGLVLDHYDRAAVETHLRTVGDRLMQALVADPPHAIFSDSLESDHADWTTKFPDEFRRRRGYDLTPYLPALAGDIGDKTMAIRHDWGRTLTELANDNYLTPIREWAHRHHTLFRSQTYGEPPVNLSSNALVDLPEGEGWQWRRFSTTRWASSASHLYSRPVTSSETWTWLHSPAFRATPLDLKAEADLHFLNGINQLIGHGWPYSPPSAGEPGWRFYAAAALNAHNPWWPLVMPDIALYLQRISFLLRQGRPVNYVAVYLPTDDVWAAFTPGNASINKAMDARLGPTLLPQILDAGYNLDFIDDDAIARTGVPYPILVLPNVERIPFATCRMLDAYVRRGGVLIATRRAPSLALGLMDAADTPKIQEWSSHLRVIDEAALGDALHHALAPDIIAAPEIGVLHRRLDFADIYFLVNTSNHPVRTTAGFRIQGLDGAWWDPFTGSVAKAGASPIHLDLAPYESRVLVFSGDRMAAPAAPAGPVPAPIDLTAALHALQPWPDPYFSGQKTYQTIVTAPPTRRRLYLTFGEGTPIAIAEHNSGNGMRAMLESPVREAAVVYVNGRRAGSVWRPPYELEVTGLLHAGANSLRIVVANLAINALSKGPLPDYRTLNARYGERFQPQDMTGLQPLPSGLLGPVHLVVR